MFRRRGRVRVALSEQDVAGGGVDRLFEEALAAGAEDFDEVTGTDQGIEVEVRSISLLDLFAYLTIFNRSHVHRRRWER